MAEAVVRQIDIRNMRGLHARASAKFVELADKFQCDISVSKDGVEVCGTSIMGLMMLAAGNGCQITVSAAGSDARSAVDALEALVVSRFGEIE